MGECQRAADAEGVPPPAVALDAAGAPPELPEVPEGAAAAVAPPVLDSGIEGMFDVYADRAWEIVAATGGTPEDRKGKAADVRPICGPGPSPTPGAGLKGPNAFATTSLVRATAPPISVG